MHFFSFTPTLSQIGQHTFQCFDKTTKNDENLLNHTHLTKLQKATTVSHYEAIGLNHMFSLFC